MSTFKSIQSASDYEVITWARNYTKHAYALRVYNSTVLRHRGSHRAVKQAKEWMDKYSGFGKPSSRSIRLARQARVQGTMEYKRIAKEIREIENDRL